MNIDQFVNGLTKLPYLGGSKTHENQVEKFLLKNGFLDFKEQIKKENKSFRKKGSRELTEHILCLPRDEIENGEGVFHPHLVKKYGYIEQPFGSQAAPDFLVVFDGLLIRLELKSAESLNPINGLNSHIPHKNYVYLFAGGKVKNKQAIFMGDDWCQEEARILMEQYNKENRILAKKFNKRLKNIPENPFRVYPRGKVTSAGGANLFQITNTPKEKAYKNNVKKFLKEHAKLKYVM